MVKVDDITKDWKEAGSFPAQMNLYGFWDEHCFLTKSGDLGAALKIGGIDYVRLHKEQINPLYLLGFSRVGCAPCVNSNKDDILNWATRFPEMIDKVRSWEQRVGRTFFAPCVPGMAINWIDDVVAWAKTDFGGRQNNLFRILPPPACESRYGLCE